MTKKRKRSSRRRMQGRPSGKKKQERSTAEVERRTITGETIREKIDNRPQRRWDAWWRRSVRGRLTVQSAKQSRRDRQARARVAVKRLRNRVRQWLRQRARKAGGR